MKYAAAVSKQVWQVEKKKKGNDDDSRNFFCVHLENIFHRLRASYEVTGKKHLERTKDEEKEGRQTLRVPISRGYF